MNAQQLEERSHKAGAAIPDLRMSHLWRVRVDLGGGRIIKKKNTNLSAQPPTDFAQPATRHRKRDERGTSVTVTVDMGGRTTITKTIDQSQRCTDHTHKNNTSA